MSMPAQQTSVTSARLSQLDEPEAAGTGDWCMIGKMLTSLSLETLKACSASRESLFTGPSEIITHLLSGRVEDRHQQRMCLIRQGRTFSEKGTLQAHLSANCRPFQQLESLSLDIVDRSLVLIVIFVL